MPVNTDNRCLGKPEFVRPIDVRQFDGDIYENGISLARYYLDNAIKNPAAGEKMRDDFVKLRKAFDNPFDIETEDCSDSKLLAYISKEDAYSAQAPEKINRLHICENNMEKVSPEEAAQTLIHEVSHLSLVAVVDYLATRMEVSAVLYGGGYPSVTLTSNYIGFDRYDQAYVTNPVFIQFFRADYFEDFGLTSEFNFNALQLRNKSIGGSMEEVLDFLGGFTIEQQKALLGTKDCLGMTPFLLAVREGRDDIVRYYLGRTDIDFNAVDIRGWDAVRITEVYGRRKTLSILNEFFSSP